MSHLPARLVLVVVASFITCTGLCLAQGFDIGKTLTPTFSDIALLPTRLTYYNLHDDSARATYTCCKPSQEEQIRKALAANAAFLERYPRTDYSDDTCMHNARVNSVRKNFRYQVEALEMLIQQFPDSDLADDGAWRLAQCYMGDKDHAAAIEVLNILVTRYPDSAWADDALFALSRELREVDDEPEAVRALRDLAYKYPSSDNCPAALDALAQSYMKEENYAAAIKASIDLIRRYPCADCADDAYMRIAEAHRHEGRNPDAMEAYVKLIDRMRGSSLVNTAMREYNTLLRNSRGSGHRIAGELYEPTEEDTGRAAQDLFDIAMHHQNYREYAAAVQTYREFAGRFPGSDQYDDALFNIGFCYQQMNILFEDLNKAKGPEELFKRQTEFEDATGAYGALPKDKLSAVRSASDAFSVVVDRLPGSPLRDDALYEIAKSFEDSGKAADEAVSYQELVISFPGSDKEFEALYRMLKWYAEPANWDKAQQFYPGLSKAYPGIFPKALTQNKTTFYQLMGAYSRHLNFAWFESFDHHIPYDMTATDLCYDADFNIGALMLSMGETQDALKRLRPLCEMPSNDFCAPAIWLVAQAQERLGRKDAAANLYEKLMTDFDWSGLADDAKMALAQLNAGGADAKRYADLAGQKLGRDLSAFDCYVGQQVVVFAPYTVSAKMREYNMPNIWENAAGLMADWTGETVGDKVLVCVGDGTGAKDKATIEVSAAGIADPPQWSLGLEQLAGCYVTSACSGKLGGLEKTFSSGLARFAAASLQYDLVTETRDAIGSAAAVALPQEEVLRTREQSLAALADYVREQKGPQDVSAEVACGMLFTLLDTRGFSRSKLVDREPFRDLFASLKRDGGGAEGLAGALNSCLGGGCEQLLQQWKLGPARSAMN
ncbi:tetratricopeptide repeat protein [bacterium]|nr:tetratricopeptide repeat protein [bacterium]